MNNKHLFLPFLVLSIFFFYSGCSENSSFDKFEYQSIAWLSLSAEEQVTVEHDVRKAKVNFDDEYRDWTKQDSEPIPAVSVSFNTKDDSLLGPIVVYISPKSKKVLGHGLRF